MSGGIATPLDRAVAVPLQRQLYLRVRQSIEAGRLRPGQRLPSARNLSAQLGVARGTVDAAFARLIGEGYIVGRGPAGTFVSAELTAPAISRAAAPGSPALSAVLGERTGPLPFQLGLPALDAFPRKLWSRLIGRAARGLPPHNLAYPDPIGWLPLREAIAAYLGISRGVTCAPGQVFITAPLTPEPEIPWAR